MKYKKSPKQPRRKILSLYTAFLFLILQATVEPAFGQWTKHIIDPNIAYTCFIAVHDIGDDGDIDVFVSEYGANSVLWYENNNMTWTKHTIDNNLDRVVGLDMADFNDDGNMDVTAVSYPADLVVWYENDGGDSPNWKKHTIDNTIELAEVVRAEDINGDGAPDLVVMSYSTGGIVWYENNLPSDWIKHIIDSNGGGEGGLNVGDFNNDGKQDVIKTFTKSNEVVLYKNNFPETNWTKIVIDENMPGTFMAQISDIDNDGDMDVAANAMDATGNEANVAWYENDGSGQTWTKHTISADLGSARGLYIEDIDNNGYMDVLVTDNNRDDVILFFNMDGGQTWTEHMIDNNFDSPNPVFAYDIDLDNDFDILPTSRVDNGLVWYENPSPSAYALSLEASPFSIQSLNDTLEVRATLKNPENHPLDVIAVIRGDQSQFMDSLQLFDDGLHSDGGASDKVWGNTRIVSGLPEDEYEVDLITYDSTVEVSSGFLQPDRFITFGPVEFEKYTFYQDNSIDDIVPNPGDYLNLKLTLKNNSSMAAATNIAAHLNSLDTLVSIIGSSGSFEDIPAGESSESIPLPLRYIKYVILISKECPVNREVPIEVNISSYGTVCWRDTFSITVVDPATFMEGSIANKIRIYPNPVNDLLNIETDQSDHRSIEITSLNGQMIYNTKMEGTTQQIDLSTFDKGVYFITIRSEKFVTTRKIIKL